MQAVGIASCAADPGVGAPPSAPSPASAAPRAEFKPKATRNRVPVDLEEWDKFRLRKKIDRVSCSWRWSEDLEELITAGEVSYKDDQAKELKRVGVYPPGGQRTRMRRCAGCGHWAPRGRALRLLRQRTVTKTADGQVVITFTAWEPVCLDCFYARMPVQEEVNVPSFYGFNRRFNDGEIGGSGFYLHTKRRRVLTDRGALREFVVDDEGGVHELAGVQNRVAEAQSQQAARAGIEA